MKRLLLIILLIPVISHAQLKSENPFLKWTTWALLQTIPSPVWIEDRSFQNSKYKFALQWQVIPLSYTFKPNKYLSGFNFFFIKPVKRYSGSAELYFQPTLVTGNFKHSDLNKFIFNTGGRIIFPVAHRGEILALSLGAGYTYQKNSLDEMKGGITFEAGIFSFFGMLGLKFNYSPKAQSRYNFGFYIKYY